MLTGEVATIFNAGGKLRKVHHVLAAPNFEVVDQINDALSKWGRLDYDGRPIFGKTAAELVELCRNISQEVIIVPAHIMTPWFGVFGSNSGFDSIEECYQDQTKHIFALETGLSADPKMLWRISSLDRFAFVSNSDSHSANVIRLGREFNALSLDNLAYRDVWDAIKSKDPNRFLFTGEVPPSLGKYHFDGHRDCNFVLDPVQSKKQNNICAVCRKKLTIGVAHRVEELADRPEGYAPSNPVPFKTLLPLAELVAMVINQQLGTKKVWEQIMKLIGAFGSELNVLLDASESRLLELTSPALVSAIMKNRIGKIRVKPGYDGVYGVPLLDEKVEVRKNPQTSLSQF